MDTDYTHITNVKKKKFMPRRQQDIVLIEISNLESINRLVEGDTVEVGENSALFFTNIIFYFFRTNFTTFSSTVNVGPVYTV